MSDPKKLWGIPLALLLLLAPSCDDDPASPPQHRFAPPTRLLPVGTVVTDTLGQGEVGYWRGEVTLGQKYVVAIVGLTDILNLGDFGPDSTFTAQIPTYQADTSLPKVIFRTPAEGLWFVSVDGTRIASTEGRYDIVLLPIPNVSGTPVAESVDITAAVPYYGQVGTRSGSGYHAHGLVWGQVHRASAFAFTASAYLSTDYCIPPSYSSTECEAGTDSIADVSVTCGPINRDGARYYVLVH